MRIWCCVLLLMSGCAHQSDSRVPDIRAIAQTHFSLFAAREDFKAFMANYAEDAILQDLVYGHHAQGKRAIADFYNWNRGDVELLETASLKVDELRVDGRTAIARGRFLRFRYGEQTLGPWRFVIWLTFDENGKIVRQYDWINYRPDAFSQGGQDLNKTLPTIPPSEP